jgi:hypothetical protein
MRRRDVPLARLGVSPHSATGYPWVDGDILYAADLNSAFLPVNGGTVAGTLTVDGLGINVAGTNGITYTGAVPGTEAQWMAFGWNGYNVTSYVNGTAVGGLAKISDLGSYLPLSGGAISGPLSANTNTGGWSANNWGKQLLVTVSGPATSPAIGITDINGTNLWAIANVNGELNIAAMPAYNNNSAGPTQRIRLTATGMGFNAATPVARPTVTGAKGSNAALASLMTALAAYGLVTDSTSA